MNHIWQMKFNIPAQTTYTCIKIPNANFYSRLPNSRLRKEWGLQPASYFLLLLIFHLTPSMNTVWRLAAWLSLQQFLQHQRGTVVDEVTVYDLSCETINLLRHFLNPSEIKHYDEKSTKKKKTKTQRDISGFHIDIWLEFLWLLIRGPGSKVSSHVTPEISVSAYEPLQVHAPSL